MHRADVVVVGGGLAGTLAAEAAASLGREVTVVEHGRRRASDAPCALVHPFAGGSFQVRPGVEAAWSRARSWFGSRSPRWVRAEVVRRWAPEGPAGNRLLRSWPQVEALAGRIFAHVVPPTAERWLEYGPVLAVDLRGLLADERRLQVERGVQWKVAGVTALVERAGGWQVQLEGDAQINARTVVAAAGAGSVALLRAYLDPRHLIAVEGTLAWTGTRKRGGFTIRGGHASHTHDTVAWGASYRVLENDRRDPTASLKGIDRRLREVGVELPPLERARQWTAVRLTGRHRRTPRIERVRPGLVVFAALGSQGCLWGPGSLDALRACMAEG